MSLHPLHLASALASVAALAVACVALLRPPAPAVDPAALAAVREELAELRHSVEVTRNQAVGPSGFTDLAALEGRVAQLEGRPASLAPVPPASSLPPSPLAAAGAPSAAPAPPAMAGPSFSPPHPAIRVELGRDGRPVVHNTDPALTGQEMVVYGIDADGRTLEVSVTVPPPA